MCCIWPAQLVLAFMCISRPFFICLYCCSPCRFFRVRKRPYSIHCWPSRSFCCLFRPCCTPYCLPSIQAQMVLLRTSTRLTMDYILSECCRLHRMDLLVFKQFYSSRYCVH